MSTLSERPPAAPLGGRRLPHPRSLPGRVVAWALGASGVGMVVSAAVEAMTGGNQVLDFLFTGVGAMAASTFLLWWVRPARRPTLTVVFAAVGAAVVATVLVGAVPYVSTGTLTQPDDAFFEATAALTTTSMTVLDVEDASRGILFWRALSQWLGGIGAVALAVSVLPFLGVGGSDLHRQAPEALRSGRFLQRSRVALEPLVRWYIGFTVAVGAAYLGAGMGVFDAVAHALTTVSTGGMSTRGASLGAFDSAAVEWVATSAMVVAGGSLALYVGAMRSERRGLRESAELRAYLIIVAGASAAAVMGNLGDASLPDVVRQSVFTVASYASTTGFVVADVDAWAPGLQALLLVVVGVGAMSGSPGGGFKVLRLMALLGYIRREIIRQLHSAAVLVVRVGREPVGEELLQRMIGYQAVFSLVGALTAVTVAASGVDLLASLAVAISAISNAGPGLGALADPSAVAELDAYARGALAVAMLAGRVEVFPLVVGLGAVADWLAPGRRRRMVVSRLAELVGIRR